MSKLPKISAHNSDSFKNAMGFNYNGNDLYLQEEKEKIETIPNDSELQNGNNFLPPISNRSQTLSDIKTATIQNLKGYFPLVIEAKLNELETKIISLEQTNFLLNDRLKSNERNFELRLKEMQQFNMEEKESRIKLEKIFNFVSDKSSNSANELKSKLQLLQEIVEKEEKWKYEQRQNDIELYKNIISKLSEKVSETVKYEIEARFKADLDNKNLIQFYSQKTSNEIDTVRREMEELGEVTKNDLKEYSKECSVRAHNLSKYIDQMVYESSSFPRQSFEKIKSFVSKLTDQVKTNVESQSFQNNIYDDKINKLEVFSGKIKEDVYNFLTIIEDRLSKRIKDLKNYTDLNIRKNFDTLNGRISELSKNIDKSLNTISSQISDTRKKLNDRMEEFETNNKTQFKIICEDIESIAERVYFYEDLIEEFDQSNKQIKTKIELDLATMQSGFHVNSVNERILHKIEVDEINSEVNQLRDGLSDFQHKITNDMQDIIKKYESNFTSVFERSKMTFDQMNKMYQSNIQIFKEFELTFEKFQAESDSLEINNLMDQMLTKIEEKSLKEDIINIQSREVNMKNYLINIEKEHEELKTMMKNEKIYADVNLLMNDILNKLDNNGSNSLYRKITAEDINIKLDKSNIIENNQIESDVHLVMDKILQKLEKNEFNEFINLRLYKNETKNKEVIERLTEFNENLHKIDKEFTETNEETKKALLEYNVIIENKINSILEKLKKENMDMWNKAIELSEKINQHDELRKIINLVPPVVIPKQESEKKIYELQSFEEKKPKPILRKFRKDTEDKSHKKVNFKKVISESDSNKNVLYLLNTQK